MRKWIFILGSLLATQLLLAAFFNLTGEEYGTFQAQEKLLSFNRQAVTILQINDGTDSVKLEKQAGKWLLPDSSDFPANQSQVEQLLDKLAALEKGWPVARTRGAAQRFAVDEEKFERKLILLADDDTRTTLYVGTSPGFRKVYVRPGNEDDIFTVDFNTWEVNAKTDDWIDKEILTIDESLVQRVEMSGITLQLREGDLQLMDPGKNKLTNVEESRALLSKLAGLRIQSLLGSKVESDYAQDELVFELRVTNEGGEVLDYRFSKPENTSYHVLKRSDLDYYFKVDDYLVNPLKETTREKLVQDTTEKTSGEPAEDQRAGKNDDASAVAEQQSEIDRESAKEDR